MREGKKSFEILRFARLINFKKNIEIIIFIEI